MSGWRTSPNLADNADAESVHEARKTILIVEDNADFREFMQTELAVEYMVYFRLRNTYAAVAYGNLQRAVLALAGGKMLPVADKAESATSPNLADNADAESVHEARKTILIAR